MTPSIAPSTHTLQVDTEYRGFSLKPQFTQGAHILIENDK